MKLALITRRYPPMIGGAEKVLSYLAPALAAEGAEVTILTGHASGLPRIEESAVAAGRLTVIRLATARLRFAGTWLYMRNLRRWLAHYPVDLAYVSMLKHDAYVAVGEGQARGFPVVLRPEGAGATGDLAWQAWGRFGRTIGRRCRHADAIVSISPAITAELLAAGYDPARVHALPNGVPIPAEPWQRRAEFADAPRALFIGRLAPEKGLDTLVDAWPAILARYPRAQLTLAGEGPERVALEARITRLGLANAVTLAGMVLDPSTLLRASDLFVLPSREEGMSIALLEAMALGVPIVASAIPGNLGLIADFHHGRLAPAGDRASWARVITEQWSDYEQAIRMAVAARDRAAAEYSIAAVARRHLDLFQSLVQRTNSPAPVH